MDIKLLPALSLFIVGFLYASADQGGTSGYPFILLNSASGILGASGKHIFFI